MFPYEAVTNQLQQSNGCCGVKSHIEIYANEEFSIRASPIGVWSKCSAVG